MKRALIGFTLVFGLLVGGAATVGAADPYTPDQGTSVSDQNATGGETVTVSASGCVPNSTVTATLDGQTLGTATADANGSASLTVKVPAGKSASGITTNCDQSTTSVLPATGSNTLPLVLTGVGLIIVGFGIFMVSRKRIRRA